MTWINDLYETYQDNLDQVGKPMIRGKHHFILLPVGHVYRNAQIEVQVTTEGDFFDARVLSKEEAPTVVPVTEASGGRTSGDSPHPLQDVLKYVAGDFEDYVETKKSGPTSFDLYIQQLAKWAPSNPRVAAVYHYLEKKTLIADLISNKVLIPDENGKLLLKWTNEMTKANDDHKPEIFSVLSGTQDAAFVRFTTHDPKDSVDEVPMWQDPQVIAAAIAAFGEGEEGLDYVTGQQMRLAESHAAGLRYSGDMAKLISANDNKNFTYRGRFVDKKEVAAVGYEVSQKAHHALKWLIAKQGITRDGRVYLVWGRELPTYLSPLKAAHDYVDEDDDIDGLTISDGTTEEEYATLLASAIYGYNRKLAINAKVNILIMDNATPGRLGILYYNTTDQNQYLQRIEHWQKKSAWRQTYFEGRKFHHYFGTAKLEDIALAAYGERGNKKVVNNAITTLFTCVVDGKKVPLEIVRNLVHQASNPQRFEDEGHWKKSLEIACSMVKNYYDQDEGGYSVSLNRNSTERNYLFGRLLAVSHVLEKQALREQGGKGRSTNAERYMNAFSTHPVRTWEIIRRNLQPYIDRLSEPTKIYYSKLLGEVMDRFEEDTYTDKPLDGRYLLGYYSQEYAIYHKSPEEVTIS